VGKSKSWCLVVEENGRRNEVAMKWIEPNLTNDFNLSIVQEVCIENLVVVACYSCLCSFYFMLEWMLILYKDLGE